MYRTFECLYRIIKIKGQWGKSNEMNYYLGVTTYLENAVKNITMGLHFQCQCFEKNSLKGIV